MFGFGFWWFWVLWVVLGCVVCRLVCGGVACWNLSLGFICVVCWYAALWFAGLFVLIVIVWFAVLVLVLVVDAVIVGFISITFCSFA